MPKKKILIVDDDRTIQAVLTALFDIEKYEVASALDAVHGTMSARKSPPDLVILDINMPAGGGQSVYDRLVGLKDFFKGAIMVYSILPREQIRTRFPELKDSQILTKPASPEDILASAERLLYPDGNSP